VVLSERIGFGLFLMNRDKEAIERLDTAINLDPNYKFSYYTKASLYEKKGNLEEAKKNLENCLKLDPNYLDA